MRRSELELSINWVRRLLPDDDQLVVIGSQSILGAFNEVLLPDDARLSMADSSRSRPGRMDYGRERLGERSIERLRKVVRYGDFNGSAQLEGARRS